MLLLMIRKLLQSFKPHFFFVLFKPISFLHFSSLLAECFKCSHGGLNMADLTKSYEWLLLINLLLSNSNNNSTVINTVNVITLSLSILFIQLTSMSAISVIKIFNVYITTYNIVITFRLMRLV